MDLHAEWWLMATQIANPAFLVLVFIFGGILQWKVFDALMEKYAKSKFSLGWLHFYFFLARYLPFLISSVEQCVDIADGGGEAQRAKVAVIPAPGRSKEIEEPLTQ